MSIHNIQIQRIILYFPPFLQIVYLEIINNLERTPQMSVYKGEEHTHQKEDLLFEEKK